MDKNINAHPEQTPDEIMLLGMLHKTGLKQKMLPPDSLDSYPKLSAPGAWVVLLSERDHLVSQRAEHYSRLRKHTLGSNISFY